MVLGVSGKNISGFSVNLVNILVLKVKIWIYDCFRSKFFSFWVKTSQNFGFKLKMCQTVSNI